MRNTQPAEMTEDEIQQLLDHGGSGVLSLAMNADAYAIPISYGFDPGATRFYFRLGYGKESEKRNYVDHTQTARLVVYENTNGGWHSVIAAGTLREISDDELNLEVVQALRQADLPLLDIFDTPRDELVFSMYALDVAELTGRKTAADYSM